MNTIQLKSFITVARTNSFSAASHLLYLSQSNVSKHIISLEKEFGEKLFYRQGRTIELTEFGIYFQEKAISIMDSYNKSKEKAKHLNDLHTKTLRVTTIPVLYDSDFIDLFESFKKTYEDTTLILTEEEPSDVINSIKSEQYDYGIIRDFYNDIHQFETIPFIKVHLVALVSKNHPLSKRKKINLLDLKDETFVSVYHESRLPAHTIQCCQSVGFTPNIGWYLRRLYNVYNYVTKGKGVALVFTHKNKIPLHAYNDMVELELEQEFTSDFLLIRNRNYSVCSASKEFERHLTANYK